MLQLQLLLTKEVKITNDNCPVKICVAYNGIPLNYKIKFKLTKDEFEKVGANNPKGNCKDINYQNPD